MKIDEYVPAVIPMKREKARGFTATPPTNRTAQRAKAVVKEVFMERGIVSIKL
jgi:hypothetical protein